MLKLLLLACVASFGAADNGRAFLLIEKVRAELSPTRVGTPLLSSHESCAQHAHASFLKHGMPSLTKRTSEVVVAYGPGRELHVHRSAAPPLHRSTASAVVRRSSFGVATNSTWPSSY